MSWLDRFFQGAAGPPGPAAASVTTPAGLTALTPSTPYPAGSIAYVSGPTAASQGIWLLDPTSTLIPNSVNVVAASLAAGGGCWLLVLTQLTLQQLGNAATVQDVGISPTRPMQGQIMVSDGEGMSPDGPIGGDIAGSSLRQLWVRSIGGANGAGGSVAVTAPLYCSYPVGGSPSGIPFQFAAYAAAPISGSAISVASASVTISAAQLGYTILQLTGTVNASNCTITIPNTIGLFQLFDISTVTFGGHSLVFTTGGTAATITAAKSGGYGLITVCVPSNNLVSAG